jgi:hypothetical protein
MVVGLGVTGPVFPLEVFRVVQVELEQLTVLLPVFQGKVSLVAPHQEQGQTPQAVEAEQRKPETLMVGVRVGMVLPHPSQVHLSLAVEVGAETMMLLSRLVVTVAEAQEGRALPLQRTGMPTLVEAEAEVLEVEAHPAQLVGQAVQGLWF